MIPGNIKLDDTNIFRLAATLYRDKEFSPQRHKTILKIIESIFLELNNEFLTIESLALKSNEFYAIELTEDEIKNSVYSNEKLFEIASTNSLRNLFRLNLSYFDSLRKKTHGLQIENHIHSYLLKEYGKVDQVAKETIFKFLHYTFTSNLNNYKIFLNLVEDKDCDTSFYSEGGDDADLINGFLRYDNENKDEAIFSIVNLSLEYCLLTSDKAPPRAHYIADKCFFLDSNMIYRAIGINGQDSKTLTLNFLERSSVFGIKFRILDTTFSEFRESIIFKTNNIFNYQHRHIDRDVFRRYGNDDFYEFYYSWAYERVNLDRDLFIAYIFSLFNEIKSEYNIHLDTTDYLRDISQKEVQGLSQKIKKWKSKYDRPISDHIVLTDAEMLLSLKNLRSNKNDSGKTLLYTRHFLISTDQQLKDWESRNSALTPVILMPSQWMTIMFRYSGRTRDDFKSFVSFLSLKSNEELAPNKHTVDKIHSVLSGISEITEDMSQQAKYADQLIENDVLKIMGDHDGEQIYFKTIEYVRNDIEQIASESKLERSAQMNDFKKLEDKARVLEEQHTILQNQHEDLKTKHRRLKNSVMSDSIDQSFRKWQNKGYISLFVLVIMLVWTLMHVLPRKIPYNPYWYLTDYFDSLSKNSHTFFASMDTLIIGGSIPYLAKTTHSRLSKKSKSAQKKLTELKQYESMEKEEVHGRENHGNRA